MSLNTTSSMFAETIYVIVYSITLLDCSEVASAPVIFDNVFAEYSYYLRSLRAVCDMYRLVVTMLIPCSKRGDTASWRCVRILPWCLALLI
jgi:hypothetical protein